MATLSFGPVAVRKSIRREELEEEEEEEEIEVAEAMQKEKDLEKVVEEEEEEEEEEEKDDSAGKISIAMVTQVLDSCKHKTKTGRRVSYSHPLFKELFTAFDADWGKNRKEIWKQVAFRTKEKFSNDDKYFQSIDVSDPAMNEADLIQIRKDIQRSGAQWEHQHDREFWLNKLSIVLKAYANHDRLNGYTQGINLFASELLSVTECEECTFYLVLYVCENIAPGFHTVEMTGLKRDIWVVNALLEQHLPELHQHLRQADFDLTYIFIGPMLSMFASVLPSPALRLFFDVLFLNGTPTVFAMWLSFFKVNEHTLMEQSDVEGIMGTLQVAMESWGTEESFHRSLLQWCMVLDVASIIDARHNCPLHWFNIDLVAKAAALDQRQHQYHQVKQQGQHREQHQQTTNQQRNQQHRRNFLLLSPGKNSSSNSSMTGGGGSGSNFTSNLVSNSPSPRSKMRKFAERANNPTTSSLSLSVVWIASNLRNPFNYVQAEEYRQAAVDNCREILKETGFENIITTQQSDPTVGHPTSYSTLLPAVGQQLQPQPQQNQTKKQNATREKQEEQEQEEQEQPQQEHQHRQTPPLSPNTQHKELAIETKVNLLASKTSHSKHWRTPESFASIEQLLDGLMNAAQELINDLVSTDENYRIHLMLENLYGCLQATRDSIPVRKYIKPVADHFMDMLETPKCQPVKWRKKLFSNVFRPRRSKESSSIPLYSSSSPSSPLLSHSPTTTASSPSSSSSSPSSSSSSSPAQEHQIQAKRENLNSNSKKKISRQLWRLHVVSLMLARKAQSENQKVGLYSALDTETSLHLSSVYSRVQNTIKQRLEEEIICGENACLDSKSSKYKVDHKTSANLAAFNEKLEHQLRLWELEPSASLFFDRWAKARKSDMLEQEPSTVSHQRFLSSTTSQRRLAVTPPNSKASKASASTSKSTSTCTSALSPPSSLTLTKPNDPPPPPLPPRRRMKKFRSQSAPIVGPGSRTSLERVSTYQLPPKFYQMSLAQVRERAVCETQQHRGLYWALRSNYVIVLEMKQLTQFLMSQTEISSAIEELQRVLHSATFQLQAKLCESVRVEYILTQFESFQTIVTNETRLTTQVQVLLDDLEDQTKLVKSTYWKSYLEKQFQQLAGDIIL